MSTLVDLNLRCMDSFRDLPLTLSKLNKKRWHLVFAAIYSSRAFSHFKHSASKNYTKISPVPSDRFVINVVPPCFPYIDQSSLTRIVKDKKLDNLVKYGGVDGVVSALKTDVEHGIKADADDIFRRREAFGTNTYRKPPTKSYFSFVWQALKDPTILILLVCAGLSLGFGMKEDGPKEGWYDGGIF